MSVAPFVFIFSSIAVLFFFVVRPQFTVKKQLKEWADANGFIVTKAERRYLFAGPFFWERSGGVYKIEVQTLGGKKRAGWIRFGYDFFRREAWSKRVVWDDSASKNS